MIPSGAFPPASLSVSARPIVRRGRGAPGAGPSTGGPPSGFRALLMQVSQ